MFNAKSTLTSICLIAGLATGSSALAKAHDNGMGDGTPSGNPSVGGQTAGMGGNAVSGGNNNGQRGDQASGAGGGNSGGNGDPGQR